MRIQTINKTRTFVYYFFCGCMWMDLLYNYRKDRKPFGFVIVSSYGHNRNISVNFIAPLLNTQQNFVEGNRTFQREQKKNSTKLYKTRMQMNGSFCRELDPSKFHSSLEIPDPTILPTFNTLSGKLCKTLLRLASCHFKLHVSLVQKTKQSKYSVQISFLYFICEYFL